MPHQDFEKYAIQRLMNGTVSKRYISFFEENVLRRIKRDFKVLDFGCGDGKYFNFFNQFTDETNIFGVEISQTRVMRCQQIGWKNVMKINPLDTLPFADSSFDLINFDQVIEHIKSEEISFYLKELKRVLADDGLIIIITPNYPIKRFYDFCNALRQRKFERIKDDPTHVAKYNFKRLHILLSEYFRIIKLEPTGGFV